MTASPEPPEGDLTAATEKRHKAWRTGSDPSAQRLVVRGKSFIRKSFQVWELNGVRIEDCSFEQADFRHTMLQDAELVRTSFRRTLFLSSRLQKSRWEELYIEDGNLNLARLNGVSAQACDIADTQLFRAQWLGAEISRMNFIRCSLHDSTWDGARISESDFRSCHLGATKGFGELATTAGAIFVDCDLRNTTWRGRDLSAATFIRCRFKQSGDEPHGAVGAPRDATGLVLTDCDVSKEELLDELLRPDDVPIPD